MVYRKMSPTLGISGSVSIDPTSSYRDNNQPAFHTMYCSCLSWMSAYTHAHQQRTVEHEKQTTLCLNPEVQLVSLHA